MKIFYGDNQFLGVNHSQGKGASYLNQYSSSEEIAITLKEAWQAGITDFCFTVNEKTIDAINLVIDECPFNLHPALPYAHRVNDLISKKGLAGALFSKAKSAGFIQLSLAGFSALFNNYDRAFRVLISTEIEGIPIKNIKSIGLLNIASDFLLGLHRKDLLLSFNRAVKNYFNKQPLFYTMNFCLMAEEIWSEESHDSIIVFNYNASGFRTNPTLDDVTKTIKKYKGYKSIAMSIFSGSDEEEVMKLLKNVPELYGVLFGTSKKTNMIKNIHLFSNIK